MNNVDTFILESRARAVSSARNSALLDAALLIVNFNESVNLCREASAIEPQEIFKSFDSESLEEALHRARLLLFHTAHVGASYHRYPGAPPFEQAVMTMKTSHPGFSESSYQLVIAKNAIGMR